MNEKEFEYNSIKLKAIPVDELKGLCEGCYFNNNDCGYTFFTNLRPSCLAIRRADETNVIFVEVEDEKIQMH